MYDPFKIVVVTTGVLGTVWGTTMAVSSNGIGGIGIALIGNALLWGTIALVWAIHNRLNRASGKGRSNASGNRPSRPAESDRSEADLRPKNRPRVNVGILDNKGDRISR